MSLKTASDTEDSILRSCTVLEIRWEATGLLNDTKSKRGDPGQVHDGGRELCGRTGFETHFVEGGKTSWRSCAEGGSDVVMRGLGVVVWM